VEGKQRNKKHNDLSQRTRGKHHLLGQDIQRVREETVQILKDDPYQLARDVFGMGFKTADKIATKLGLGETEPPRLRAGVEYALQEATNEGHPYLAPSCWRRR